ncbi:MAG TPA: RimK/LysX family protein [Candidatus Saccharimonadales bacterium]|nr:RimK/LysX family protein [Candidatus Saccharimonadales bacterium]
MLAIVSLPELHVKNVIAKVDTGAYSGALHATDIRERVNKKGEPVLVFNALGNPEYKARTTNYRRKRVVSSNGHKEERYVIQTSLEINGKRYRTFISLTNRSGMTKGVLIGRQFLRSHNFVVDVRQGTQYRNAVKD